MKGSSVFKNTSFSTSHSQLLAPPFGLQEVTRAEWRSRLLRLWNSTQHPRVHITSSPPLQPPKARKPQQNTAKSGAFHRRAKLGIFGAKAFGEQLCIILERECNLLAVFLMQGQCLLYQRENLVTDRTLPILYSSPIDTIPEHRIGLKLFLKQNSFSQLGAYMINGNDL